MKVGTKSLLFGVHQFIIHPAFLFVAWWRLFGFPWNPLLWLSFIVHDWGYWECRDMNGYEGSRHMDLGARILQRFGGYPWWSFCYYHSRHAADLVGRQPSRLCVADKYVTVIEPWWFYLPRAWASGELWGYIKESPKHRDGNASERFRNAKAWYCDMQRFLQKWVDEHKNIRGTI